MITVFATPKPFTGIFANIQHNAIVSWTLMQPRPEIILFGADEGISEIAQELRLIHIADVATSEFGTPLVNELFTTAQREGSHDIFCYLNSDIILTNDFMRAVEAAKRLHRPFLMVGQRCTVEVKDLPSFEDKDLDSRLRAVAESGDLESVFNIDYFVFSRGLFADMPPFAIGRPFYDNWLIWSARRAGASVIDATDAVLALHQRHDYSHVPKGQQWVFGGEEAQRNRALAGSPRRLHSVADANFMLTAGGSIQPAKGAKYESGRLTRRQYRVDRRRSRLEGTRVMQWSRPLRHRLGLRWSTWDRFKRLWKSSRNGVE